MDLQQFYTNKLNNHNTKATRLKKQIRIIGLLRLFIFFSVSGLVYFFSDQLWSVVSIIVIGTGLFLVLLLKHLKLKQLLKLEKALKKINTDEIKIDSGNFHFKRDGLEFLDPNHAYCLDIDLFGRGSFFQNLDRTETESGSAYLSQLLKDNRIDNIESRQRAIKELSEKADWRQNYQATASLIKTEQPIKTIINWLDTYQPKLPKFSLLLSYGFSLVFLVTLILTIFKTIDYSYIGYLLLIGLGISAMYLKAVSNIATYTSKIKDTFKQYSSLLELIETEDFESELLKTQQKLISKNSEKASTIFKTFSKHLDALDNRNNMIGAIFGNGYFLNDLRNAYQIEQWITKHKNTVAHWFDVIAFFDAYQSLGTYTFNHTDFNFPKITEDKDSILAKDLGHPLLKKGKRITSDLQIENEQFFIVTGANMAGKSTFLRTVSLHIVMANMGLPVCATKSTYYPTKLITSMRTTDNLTDDSSYFFSELTRLKYIVEAIKTENYFIILDEILKGTNSKDKAEGSKKFVQKLVASNATGIIATHDLSLCTIEDELAEVKNYYFDAFIQNDELSFDYKFKKGICQNMNASFLLKKMAII
jgi:hypothetical protein